MYNSKAERPDLPLRIAIPKGSLERISAIVINEAKIPMINRSCDRQYVELSASPDEYDVRIMRPADIAQGVRDGWIDMGIVGLDQAYTTLSRVDHLVGTDALGYSKNGFTPITWKLVVPKNSGIENTEDLFMAAALKKARGQSRLTIAAENSFIAFNYVLERFGNEYSGGQLFTVLKTDGATEAFLDWSAEAAIDVSETGKTFEANGLRAIDDVFTSSAALIYSRYEVENAGRYGTVRANKMAYVRSRVLDAAQRVGNRWGAELEGPEL